MRLFLIDYENVNSAGLHGIGQLSQQDRVILFYSQSANTLSFEIMDEMLAANLMPERVCIAQSGKNALDFQLVTFLGYLIAKNKAEEYYIISKDTGYSAAAAFCQSFLGTVVQIKPSILAAISGKNGKKTGKKRAAISLRKRATVIQVPSLTASASVHTTKEQSSGENDGEQLTVERVRNLIDLPVSEEIAAQILECLRQSSSKTEFHNALQQCFGNDDVKEYYRCMKPCFSAALKD